jgi:7-carboxy-7-deazaguanine synthase
MSETLIVNEIFLSLQGESTFAGLPCIFIRLTGCNLRCSYCDTSYAFADGQAKTVDEIETRIQQLAQNYAEPAAAGRLPLIELTGGEPLLQPGALPLLRRLCDHGYTVLLETNGAVDIAPVDPRVHRIVDLKCPSSGEEALNRWENIAHLKAIDEMKFVIATHEDYLWARQTIREYHLETICPVLVSWAEPPPSSQPAASLQAVPAHHTPMTRRELAERVLTDALPVRLQVQLHKIIWPPDTRGV